MKVYTYEDLYGLTETEFWEEIKGAPHLCASQTLVEGLISHYGRTNFEVITTIDEFLNYFYDSWKKDPVKQMEQFLYLSESLREIDDIKLRKTMIFNKNEIFEALRFLFEVRMDPQSLDLEKLSKEQKALIKLYQKFQSHPSWSFFQSLLYKDEEDVKDVLIEVLCEEIKTRAQTQLQGKNRLELLKSLNSHRRIRFRTVPREQITAVKEHYGALLEKYDPMVEEVSKIVIHGVHQFTPLIIQFINQMERAGLEVIFILNKVHQFPKLFETWKRTYKWLKPEWSPDHRPYLNPNPLGTAIGNMIEGKTQLFTEKEQYKVYKFENLSSFAETIAQEFKFSDEKLAKMDDHFYGVRNQEINELLKAYFPKHFKEKKFLSYPIGQFILSIYNMWDIDEKKLYFKKESLKECLSVNLFIKEGYRTPLTLFEHVAPYLEGVEKEEEIFKLLAQLKISLEEISGNPSRTDLKKFSFFTVKVDELEYLIEVLSDLSFIAKRIFEDYDDSQLDYGKHYQNLVRIIEEKVKAQKNIVTDEEISFLEELKARFNTLGDDQLKGNVQDLKETLAFYVQVAKKNDDGSSWICRNFEQLDGAMLMNSNNEEKTLHLGLLSNEKVNVKINDLLPWPLDEDFFKAYSHDDRKIIEVVLCAKSEYKNFLRYSLFYAAYYSRSKIHLSFIENSEGEQESFYFLMDMLGLTPEPFENQQELTGILTEGKTLQLESVPLIDNEEAQQDYNICDYRFFQHHIVGVSNYYKNDWHFRFYYKTLLFEESWRILDRMSVPEELIQETVNKKNKELSKYFPFWNANDLFDLEKLAVKDLKSVAKDGRINRVDDVFLNIRKRFLTASVRTKEVKNYLLGVHQIGRGVREESTSNYFNKSEIHQSEVYHEICNRCKQRDLCLTYYQRGE